MCAGDSPLCLQHYAPVCGGKRHRAAMSNSANRAQRCHIVLGASRVVNRTKNSRENQACISLHMHAPRILTDNGDRRLSVLLPRTLNPWLHGFHVTFRIVSSNPAMSFLLAVLVHKRSGLLMPPAPGQSGDVRLRERASMKSDSDSFACPHTPSVVPPIERSTSIPFSSLGFPIRKDFKRQGWISPEISGLVM